jgi:hypothetical protein
MLQAQDQRTIKTALRKLLIYLAQIKYVNKYEHCYKLITWYKIYQRKWNMWYECTWAIHHVTHIFKIPYEGKRHRLFKNRTEQFHCAQNRILPSPSYRKEVNMCACKCILWLISVLCNNCNSLINEHQGGVN